MWMNGGDFKFQAAKLAGYFCFGPGQFSQSLRAIANDHGAPSVLASGVVVFRNGVPSRDKTLTDVARQAVHGKAAARIEAQPRARVVHNRRCPGGRGFTQPLLPNNVALHKFTPQRPLSAQFPFARPVKSTIFQSHKGWHRLCEPNPAGLVPMGSGSLAGKERADEHAEYELDFGLESRR
jgi:hypothetical protein